MTESKREERNEVDSNRVSLVTLSPWMQTTDASDATDGQFATDYHFTNVLSGWQSLNKFYIYDKIQIFDSEIFPIMLKNTFKFVDH